MSEIAVPNLARIDEGAFQYSTGISGTFKVTDKMQSIGSYAFQGTQISAVDVTVKLNGFSFGDGVFSDCFKLREFLVNDGSGIWNFNSVGLFEGCISLKQLTGLQRCSIIGPRTFKGCSGMYQDDFSFNEFCVEIGDSAFEATGFTEIDLRSCCSLTTLGSSVFKNCIDLREFRFESELAGVVQKAQSLFEGCSSLKNTYWNSVTDKLQSIPDRFFYGCTQLDGSVFSSSTVTSIGESAFEGTATSQFDLSQATCTIGIAAFRDCQSLQSFTLPTGALEIPRSLFENCGALGGVTGEGVTSVGPWSFYKCSSLNGVTLGQVTAVGAWAFCGCVQFSTESFLYAVKDSLSTLGASAFENTHSMTVDLGQCTQLNHDELPPALFRDCLNLNKFTLSSKTNHLPANFFEKCWSLSDLTWAPDSFTSVTIGTRAFSDCGSLNDPKYFTAYSYGDYVFAGTGFETIDLSPEEVSYDAMGKGTFKGCMRLKTVILGNHDLINEEMFAGCENLERVDQVDQLTFIGMYSFAGCSKFSDTKMLQVSCASYALVGTGYTRIDFDETANSFFDGCFQDCKSLEWVRLGSFGDYVYPDFFAGCSNLVTIEGLEQITGFGSSALMGCPLTSLSLSPDMNRWDSHCFEGLAITSLDLTNIRSAGSIPEAAFKDCKSLSEVKFGDAGIGEFGAQAFQGCESLRSITIPEKIVSIGVDCFRDCTSLETVTYEGTSEITNSIFRGCDSLKTVNVPSNYPYDRFGDWQLKSTDGDGTNKGEGGGDDNPLPPGGIAGIVIAVLIIVGAAVFVAVFFLVIRKRRNTPDDEDDEDETVENTSSVHI